MQRFDIINNLIKEKGYKSYLEWVAEYHKEGNGRNGKKLPLLFHTSHPQLIGYLNGSKKWVLKSQQMYGGIKNACGITARNTKGKISGYGGHFRAVQGFKYIGNKEN